MNIYPIEDKQGKLHAFEIENWKTGRSKTVKIIKGIPEVIILREPKRFLSWFREEVFCEFKINETIFQIEEFYGDNSRYWIGKKEEGGWCRELELVKKVFQAS